MGVLAITRIVIGRDLPACAPALYTLVSIVQQELGLQLKSESMICLSIQNNGVFAATRAALFEKTEKSHCSIGTQPAQPASADISQINSYDWIGRELATLRLVVQYFNQCFNLKPASIDLSGFRFSAAC